MELIFKNGKRKVFVKDIPHLTKQDISCTFKGGLTREENIVKRKLILSEVGLRMEIPILKNKLSRTYDIQDRDNIINRNCIYNIVEDL